MTIVLGEIFRMHIGEEHLICMNHECRAEIYVSRNLAVEIQNLRCSCGSEFKKIYHPPVLTALGKVPEHPRALDKQHI